MVKRRLLTPRDWSSILHRSTKLNKAFKTHRNVKKQAMIKLLSCLVESLPESLKPNRVTRARIVQSDKRKRYKVDMI